MHSVLVTLPEKYYGNVLTQEHLKDLERVAKVTLRPDIPRADEDALIAALEEADADIILTGWQSPKVTMKVHRAWPKLKLMAHTSGGVRPYIEKEVIEDGVILTNWGTSTSRSTAEGAFAMTLAILRNYQNMPFWMRIDKLYWETPGRPDEGLFEQRVGLHGLGAIAQEYVRFIAPFGCSVMAYSPHCPDEVFERLGVKRATSLEQLYSSNRIISCHAAMTEANYHIVNANILALIEDGGYFINTGRGGVVDTEALIAELKSGRISAALDVFETEPLEADSPLRQLENCFVVPHRAGPTPDRRVDMGANAVKNILRFISGEELDSLVSPRKYDLMT